MISKGFYLVIGKRRMGIVTEIKAKQNKTEPSDDLFIFIGKEDVMEISLKQIESWGT